MLPRKQGRGTLVFASATLVLLFFAVVVQYALFAADVSSGLAIEGFVWLAVVCWSTIISGLLKVSRFCRAAIAAGAAFSFLWLNLEYVKFLRVVVLQQIGLDINQAGGYAILLFSFLALLAFLARLMIDMISRRS